MAYRYFAFAISLCFLRLLPVIYGQTYTPVFKECACGLPKKCDYGRMKCAPPDDNCNKENVALGKPSHMSSRYDGTINFKEYSCLAVDGLLDPIYRPPNDSVPNCVLTAKGDKEPYWEVDLGFNYTVTHLTYSVPSYRDEHMRHTRVYVDGVLCYAFPTFAKYIGARDEIDCITPVKGRKIRFDKAKRDNPPDEWVIPLCEVQVWVCVQGYYGKQCDQFCGGCKFCENYYGACSGGCNLGYFGFNCTRTCDNCAQKKCHVTTGNCLSGCIPGWLGPNCTTPCDPMTFGLNCMNNCTNCIEDDCSPIDGKCKEGCFEGFEGELCDKAIVIEEEGTNPAIYVAAVFGALAFIGILLLVYSKLPKKKKKKIVKVKKAKPSGEDEEGGDKPVEAEAVAAPPEGETKEPETPAETPAEVGPESEKPKEEKGGEEEEEEEEEED